MVAAGQYGGVSHTGTDARIKCEIFIYKTGDGKVEWRLSS